MGAITATILTIASAAAAAASQIQTAKAQKSAADAQADAQQKALDNTQAEQQEQNKRERINARSSIAQLKARLATQGSVNSEGTPLLILGEQTAAQETTFQDAARAQAMQAQAVNHQTALTRWQGAQATKNLPLNLSGTILSAAAKTYGQIDHNQFTGAYQSKI